jgi:hypothetical protein
MKMTMIDILELISDIPEKQITKALMQELVCRAYKEGRKDVLREQKKIDKEIKSELGYSRVGKDAMRRG